MYRATIDENLIAILHSAIDNEIEEHESQRKMFKCKIVDKYSKGLSRPIRATISDDVKMIIYATNCHYEIKPGDNIDIKDIGKFKVDTVQIDYSNERNRYFNSNPAAMKILCPKIISLR